MSEGRRIRRFILSTLFIENLIRDPLRYSDLRSFTSDLPSDFAVVSLRSSEITDGLVVYVVSDSFEPVADGHEIPMIYPKWTIETKERALT